jgi:rsbT co-antagonist protein RsbR
MHLTRKLVGTILLAIQVTAATMMLAGQLVVSGFDTTALAIAVAVVVTCIVLVAYRRDWPYAGPANVVLMTLLVGFGTPEPFVTKATAPISLTPIAVALILARPAWIIAASVGVLAIYSGRAGIGNNFINAYIGDLRSLGTIVFMTGSMFLSRLVADHAQNAATQEAQRADRARAEAEEKADALATQTALLMHQNTEQQRLIQLVDVLEVPIVTLEEHVLLAPLIGQFDQRRLESLTQRLLHQVATQRTALVLLDMSGVPHVEPDQAALLERVVQALKLLGCTVMLTGLKPAVAQTLAAAQVSLRDIATFRTPQEALASWRVRYKK